MYIQLQKDDATGRRTAFGEVNDFRVQPKVPPLKFLDVADVD